jgi:hypothetical protein
MLYFSLDQRPERDPGPHDLAAAVPDDQRDRDRAHQFEDREEERVVVDRLEIGVAVPGVEHMEGVEVPALPVEDLHGAHAAQILVEEGVEPRQPRADVTKRPAHLRPEAERDDGDQGQHGEGDGHQLGVDPRHRDQDAEQGEQVAEDRHHAGGEHLVEHVDVVGHAGEQPAHRVAIEERDRQALEMTEQRHAQVHHDALPNALHDLGLQVSESEADQQHRQVEQRHAVEIAEVAMTDAVVDRLHGEPGAGELRHRVEEDDRDRQGHP